LKSNYLALGGLFACLHVLFLLASKIIVGSELLLVLFLPLLSTIYTLKSDKKNVIMFVIATLLVCSVFDIVNTFIYVIPSLVCGVVYGVLRKYNFKELELLCISGICHIFSLLFSFVTIAILFKEVDFMEIFASIFGLNGKELIVISFSFLMVLGFCEAFLVHIVSDSELAKFSSKVEKNETVPKWFSIGALISFIMCIILYFVNNIYSVLAMMLLFVFIIPYIVSGIMNYKYKVLTTSLIIIFSFISIFALKYIEPLNYMIIPVFILSPTVINNFKDIKGKNF